MPPFWVSPIAFPTTPDRNTSRLHPALWDHHWSSRLAKSATWIAQPSRSWSMWLAMTLPGIILNGLNQNVINGSSNTKATHGLCQRICFFLEMNSVPCRCRSKPTHRTQVVQTMLMACHHLGSVSTAPCIRSIRKLRVSNSTALSAPRSNKGHNLADLLAKALPLGDHIVPLRNPSYCFGPQNPPYIHSHPHSICSVQIVLTDKISSRSRQALLREERPLRCH